MGDIQEGLVSFCPVSFCLVSFCPTNPGSTYLGYSDIYTHYDDRTKQHKVQFGHKTFSVQSARTYNIWKVLFLAASAFLSL